MSWTEDEAAADATPPGRRRNMQAIHRKDTKPELAVRSLLHAAGLRYRCDLRLTFGERAVRPDIVFTRRKIAVFIDGCFWHSCPEHGVAPKKHTSYWGPKLAKNRERDAANTTALESNGWIVIRAWEHGDPAEVAAEIEQIVVARASVVTPGGRRCALRPATCKGSTVHAY